MAFFTHSWGAKHWVVQCKGCNRDIPACVDSMPKVYIAVRCPMCREHLPTQGGIGYLHHEVQRYLLTERKPWAR